MLEYFFYDTHMAFLRYFFVPLVGVIHAHSSIYAPEHHIFLFF